MPTKAKTVLMQPAVGSEKLLIDHAVQCKRWLEAARKRFIQMTGVGKPYKAVSLKDGHKKPKEGAEQDMYAPSARAFVKASEKAAKYKANAEDGYRYIKDMIRCSIQYENCGEMARALQALYKDRTVHNIFRIVEAKDHVDVPKPGLYSDVNLIVVCPENYHLCEVQLHFREMLAAKDKDGHKLYNRYRAADGTLNGKGANVVRGKATVTHGSFGGPATYDKQVAAEKRALMNRYSAQTAMGQDKVYGNPRKAINRDHDKQALLSWVRKLGAAGDKETLKYLDEVESPLRLKKIKQKLGFVTGRQGGGRNVLNKKKVGQHLAHMKPE